MLEAYYCFFGVDTDVYAKTQLDEDRSVVFLGMVSNNRENNIKITIIEPGLKLGGSYRLIQDKDKYQCLSND